MDITDMLELKDAIFAALAGIAVGGASIVNAFGGWEPVYNLLITAMIIDLLTGWALAAFFKKSPKSESGALDSKASFRGVAKKVATLLLVFLAAMIDKTLATEYTRSTVSIFFIGNEGLSILENVGMMGVPYPRFLREMLEALRVKGDGGADDPDLDGGSDD